MADPQTPADAAAALPGLVDTHCHLNHPRLLPRLPQVLARAAAAGVTDMIVVGYDLPSSRQAVALAAEHEGLWAAVGIHPHEAAVAGPEAIEELRRLARRPGVVAIGETGLDFYRDLSPREAQRAAFLRHLEIAAELDLPAVIHCRDAQDAVLDVVAAHPCPRLVWHCFDGSVERAQRALALGMRLSFGGRITHRGAEYLRRAAAAVPLDRMLLETDAPYLAPEPRRSRDNEPANLPAIAEAVALSCGRDLPAIAAATATAAYHLFRIDAR